MKTITNSVYPALAAFALLAMAGCTLPQITVAKLPDQIGGKYSISGTNFTGNESVRLEIENVPLRANPFPLGFAHPVNGSFSFQTEQFRCTYVQDEGNRDKWKNQQITFVATRASSNLKTTAVSTASGIFICP